MQINILYFNKYKLNKLLCYIRVQLKDDVLKQHFEKSLFTHFYILFIYVIFIIRVSITNSILIANI